MIKIDAVVFSDDLLKKLALQLKCYWNIEYIVVFIADVKWLYYTKLVKMEIQSKLFFAEEKDENRNIVAKDWLDFEISENVGL